MTEIEKKEYYEYKKQQYIEHGEDTALAEEFATLDLEERLKWD